MREIIEFLQSEISSDKIMINEQMSKHTSFKVGGPADIFVKARNARRNKKSIGMCKKI